MDTPEKIGVAGDWHGNTRWALHATTEMCDRIGRFTGSIDDPKLILHLGDFGIWPGKSGFYYINELRMMLRFRGAKLWFAEGNHEDYTQLDDFHIEKGNPDKLISWLPRGHRWEWHGRKWMALGGAASVDKACRTPYVDWWPEEEITYKQAANVIESGHADVMVCHDAPTGVPFTFPLPPSFWNAEDIRRSDNHRDLMREIVLAVQPKYFLHGHYHQGGPYWREIDMPYGPLQVASLPCDGMDDNWGILNVKTMIWE